MRATCEPRAYDLLFGSVQDHAVSASNHGYLRSICARTRVVDKRIRRMSVVRSCLCQSPVSFWASSQPMDGVLTQRAVESLGGGDAVVDPASCEAPRGDNTSPTAVGRDHFRRAIHTKLLQPTILSRSS